MAEQNCILLEEESATEFGVPKHRGAWAQRVIVSSAAALALVGTGYAAGLHATQGRRGNVSELEGDSILSIGNFNSAYHTYTSGLSALQVVEANAAIAVGSANGVCDATLDFMIVEMCGWAKSQRTNTALISEVQKTLAGGYTAVVAPAAAPEAASAAAPRAGAAPISSISSNSDFGIMYSHETAGKPWPEIVKIDRLVRETHLPESASVALKSLNHWYHHHATQVERKDFDDNVVAHAKM